MFQIAIHGVKARFGSGNHAVFRSTAFDAKLGSSVRASGEWDQPPKRKQPPRLHRGTTQSLRLPARVMPALVPALILFCCVFVILRTAHGQASQDNRGVEVPELIKQLAQVDFEQRETAERKLIEIGSPAVEPLVDTLLDCTPDVCSRTKRILQAVAEDCDEESLFKILAALQIRFEVPTQRIEFLLDRWTVGRRQAAITYWRAQGAIVDDPHEHIDLANERDEIEKQMRIQKARQQGFPLVGTEVAVPESDVREKKVIRRPIAERLQFVLGGSLKQNKKLVLGSMNGATSFENNVSILQQKPVFVTIGKDWRGDSSDFDVAEVRSSLLISNLVVQQKEIDDSLLTVLKKHPLSYVTLNECSIAAGTKEKLPASLKTLVIENSITPAKMLDLVARDGSTLGRVRFVSSKFGKNQAAALEDFSRLQTVELVKIDLQADAFEGLALLSQLRQVEIVRCKFPAAAFLELKRERPTLVGKFTAKAFLGVGTDPPGMVFRRLPEPSLPEKITGREDRPRQAEKRGGEPAQVEQRGCTIATVVAGQAAERAGIKPGDVVLRIGGQDINSFDELRIAIAQCEIGDEVPITIRRDGKEKTLKAKMGVQDE